jgi:hypothetical protein
VSVSELARLRSADLLETGEVIWAATASGSPDEQTIDEEDEWRADPTGYEEYLARKDYILEGVRTDVKRPDWVAARAAFYGRETAALKVEPDARAEVARAEARAQFDLYREIAGPGWADVRWPQWRTSTVLALARGIHRTRAHDSLPILADALQDAGCDDETVLAHCREGTGHVCGCWVVELAMGTG